MSFYLLVSKLLEYPEQDLVDNIAAINSFIDQVDGVSVTEKQVILDFAEWLGSLSLIEQQSHYVDTFDTNQEHSLHVTHHLYGDSKERGPALSNLIDYYRSYGWEVSEKELPDFLPMMLEFVSQLDDMAARVFLADASKALIKLRENLEQSNNPYATLVKLLEQRGRLTGMAA
jgi:nitrate reductase molybdenum cofactor assembly chaperone NarJ/NarW